MGISGSELAYLYHNILYNHTYIPLSPEDISHEFEHTYIMQISKNMITDTSGEEDEARTRHLILYCTIALLT